MSHHLRGSIEQIFNTFVCILLYVRIHTYMFAILTALYSIGGSTADKSTYFCRNGFGEGALSNIEKHIL